MILGDVYIMQPCIFDFPKFVSRALTEPQRENFPGGTKVDTWPPNHIAPPSLIGDHAVKSFCRMGVDLHNNIRIQLGPTKNTSRHKIGLNPARGSGGAL